MRTGRPREGNARRVTLSVKVTEKERDELKARWGSAYVGLRKAVENLLGGVVLRVGDTVYDASVSTQLEQMRTQMINRSIHEIQSRRDRFGSPAGN